MINPFKFTSEIYSKWIQTSDVVGICIGLHRDPISKERWSISFLPQLEVWKLPKPDGFEYGGHKIPPCDLYGIRLMFIVWSLRIDIEMLRG